jgi:hypothetical protein
VEKMRKKQSMNDLNINAITVHNIDTSSGIFVGINNAHNWSSHRKNNYGLGPADSAQVSQNMNLLIDNDIVDMPFENNVMINQAGNKVLKTMEMEAVDGQTSGMETKENIGGSQEINNIAVSEINLTAMDTNAAVSIGENSLNGWSAHSKRNEGTGRSTGVAQYKSNTNIVIDNDLIDGTINDNSVARNYFMEK